MPGRRCDPADVIQIQAARKVNHLFRGPVASVDEHAPQFRLALRPARFNTPGRPEGTDCHYLDCYLSPPTNVASVRRESGTADSTITGPFDSGTRIGSSIAMIS